MKTTTLGSSLFRSAVLLAAALLAIPANVVFGAWSVTAPSNNANLSKTADVNCSGEATNAGVSYTVEIADKNAVVRSSANGTSVLGLPNSWGVTVVRPIGDWDTALNNYTITIKPAGGGNASITVTFVT